MTNRDDGGPAFPSDPRSGSRGPSLSGGMSLRDYFAAAALTACSASAVAQNANLAHNHIAGVCYSIADAMLAERKK